MTYLPGAGGGSVAWSAITGKPSTFTPSAHGHVIADTTSLQTSLDAKLDDSQASAFGLSLIDDADAPTAQATLGLGLTNIEVNLGAVPRTSGSFTISGSSMTVGKPVTVTQAVGPYTGKGTRADEAEMDRVTVAASVTSATVITAYWSSARRVRGNFKFNYILGA